MDELLSNNEGEEEEKDDNLGRDKLEQPNQDKDKEDEAFLDHQIEEGVQDERDSEEGEVIDGFEHTPGDLESCDQCMLLIHAPTKFGTRRRGYIIIV